MASPIGEVPAAFDLGYDNNPLAPPNSVYYPLPPLPVFAGTYSTGSVNTASTDTTGAQTLSTFARLTTAQMYVNPLYLDRDVWFREMEIGISGNTVAGTGSVTGGWLVGLYSQSTTWASGTGTTDMTSGTLFSKVSDFGYGFRMSQNSVTSASYLLWKGTDYGNSSLTAYASSLSTSGAGSDLFTGQRDLQMYSNSTPQTLQAGNYLVLHGFTKTSAGANVFSVPHGMFVSNSLTAASGTYFGSTDWRPPMGYLGSMTTSVSSTHSTGTVAVPQGVNFLPASFVASQIPTQTGSADVKWLVPSFYY